MSGGSPRMQNDDSDCVRSCEQPWEADGQHCYLWSEKLKRSWDKAELFCRQATGGHLASVTSNATNQYILFHKPIFEIIEFNDCFSNCDHCFLEKNELASR